MIFPLYSQPQGPPFSCQTTLRLGVGVISSNSLKLLSPHFPRCCPGLADDPPGAHGAGAKLLRVDLTGPLAGCEPHLLDPLYTGPGSFLVSPPLKLGQVGVCPASPVPGLVGLWFVVAERGHISRSQTSSLLGSRQNMAVGPKGVESHQPSRTQGNLSPGKDSCSPQVHQPSL